METQASNSYSPASSRSITSLDGLRALSIMIVILAHSAWSFPEWLKNTFFTRFILGSGSSGVGIFFVISGYLITTLLLREFKKTKNISLKHFYFRRTLRIFPPFYTYLSVIGVLWGFNIIPQHLPSFVAALTYTWAYFAHAHGYFIAHSWSLSIEEQFYLGWPLLFLFFYPKKNLIRNSLIFIFTLPLIRVLLYFIAPSLRGYEGYMIQGWIDTIMVGCLLALLKNRNQAGKLFPNSINTWTVGVMAGFAFAFCPWFSSVLPKPFGGLFTLLFSPTIKALCMGGIILYAVENENSLLGKVLNHKVLKHIGVLSYSLYLWQQIFMAKEFSFLPYGYFYALAAAQLSYWLIENPSLKLRQHLERKWKISTELGSNKPIF